MHQPIQRRPDLHRAGWWFLRSLLVLGGWFCGIGGSISLAAEPGTGPLAAELKVQPASIRLTHRKQPWSIVVTGKTVDGYDRDLTSQATFTSTQPQVATVDLLGWVSPVANGKTEIKIAAEGKTSVVAVEVQLNDHPLDYSFLHDVMPVLSKAGCNAGACHGYSLGKNGFKLSLRGSDAAPDFAALTDEFLARRINLHNPPASLLLTKPLGDVPHKGGIRFDHGGLLHKTLLGWIEQGAQGDLDNPARLESIQIFPENVVLPPGGQHQMQLVASYSDGSQRDVSHLAVFTANTESVATVDDVGLVTTLAPGETPMVGRFERIFATANFIVLPPNPGFQPNAVPTENLIDQYVIRKLNDLRITPSELAPDARFLRRVYLDLIGVQPTPDELLAFVKDSNPAKREQVVDRLFARPEFVDWWSLKWGDLLQNSRNQVSEPAMFAFREWIRAAVAENKPLDAFTREILTSRGSYTRSAPGAFFAVSKDTDETLQRATQVFCGVRMLCAQCHPHPFENWTQGDYYGLHSFFNQVATKADPALPGVANAKTVLLNVSSGFSTNPRTGRPQPPRYLGGGEPELPAGIDRREAYAAWLTSAENPFFARSMTNRIWSYFFHRGIIEPVDDLRTTNPPINPPLLDALTADFVEHDFDVRHLMRRIVTSDTYQRSTIANGSNAHDDLNFSRAIPRRLSAESMLDSLIQATGVPENFPGAPAGFTAAQLPDANIQSEFLALFGKPQRMEACECERDSGSNMLQALHFINGKSILGRVAAPNGRLAKLLQQKDLGNEQLVEQLYLWSLARQPTSEEAAVGVEFLGSQPDKRAEAAQDLMWALLNSRDFMLVH